MSLIGPRPERPEFVELFRQDIVRYGDRHRVKSGITGWAQVHGLRGQTSLAERVEWDNYYIAHWSLGLDLKILAADARRAVPQRRVASTSPLVWQAAYAPCSRIGSCDMSPTWIWMQVAIVVFVLIGMIIAITKLA